MYRPFFFVLFKIDFRIFRRLMIEIFKAYSAYMVICDNLIYTEFVHINSENSIYMKITVLKKILVPVIAFFNIVLIDCFGCCKFEDPKSLPDIECRESRDITELDNVLDDARHHYKSKDILVVFDFNYTLMYPSDPCMHKYNLHMHRDLLENIFKRFPAELIDKIYYPLMTAENQTLVSDNLPKMLKAYPKMNFLVCSAAVDDNADFYADLLAAKGISMVNHYGLQDFEFSEFKDPKYGAPQYRRGVITANGVDKGRMTAAFLKRIARKPKIIFFVDDTLGKLQDVANASKAFYGAKLQLILYRECEKKAIAVASAKDFEKYWIKRILKKLDGKI